MKNGFTLLEILLSMSLITGMLGVVMVNYRQANNKQAVQGAINRFRQTVETAKSNAMNGKKDTNICGSGVSARPLDGWAVSFTANSYSLFGVCDVPGRRVKFPAVVHAIVLPSGINIGSSSTLPQIDAIGRAVEFRPIGQGTNLVVPAVTFTISGTGGTGQVQVTRKGEISSTVVSP
jgi:prepilin-type N-terminal cleavage/methylation domain-containing protein